MNLAGLTWWRGVNLSSSARVPGGGWLLDSIEESASSHQGKAIQELQLSSKKTQRKSDAPAQRSTRAQKVTRVALPAAPAPIESDPDPRNKEDALALRDIHELLRARFLIAVNAQSDELHIVGYDLEKWKAEPVELEAPPVLSGFDEILAELEQSSVNTQLSPQLEPSDLKPSEPSGNSPEETWIVQLPIEEVIELDEEFFPVKPAVPSQIGMSTQNQGEAISLEAEPQAEERILSSLAAPERDRESPDEEASANHPVADLNREYSDFIPQEQTTETMDTEVAVPTLPEGAVLDSQDESLLPGPSAQVDTHTTTQAQATQPLAPPLQLASVAPKSIPQKQESRPTKAVAWKAPSLKPTQNPSPSASSSHSGADAASGSHPAQGSGMTMASLHATSTHEKKEEKKEAIVEKKGDPKAEPVVAPAAVTAVEAFDWKVNLSEFRLSRVTQEEREGQSAPRGWNRLQALDRWPTLSWSSDANPIPVLSHNSARMLAVVAGTGIQGGTGIVFGKVPKNWTVQISARAEGPVFLDEINHSIPSHDTSKPRYFAFVNVAPGGHLLYLADPRGTETAAMSVIVEPEAATYADLSRPTRVTVRGRVLDANARKPKGLPRVSVKVVGQASRNTITDRFGEFRMEQVVAFGDHPIHVESSEPEGFTHRYKVAANGRAGDLFRFDRARVQSWIEQLEGGISGDSGLIVAGVTGLLRTRSGLEAHVRPLIESAPLVPEIYTLSREDHLRVDRPLSVEESTIVSLQLPEGANLLTLEQEGKPAYSELVISSPGVINVVGPY